MLGNDNWSNSRRNARNYLCSPCGRIQDAHYRDKNRAKYNAIHAEYMKQRLLDPVKRDEYNAYFREYTKRRKALDPTWSPKASTKNRYQNDPVYREKVRAAAKAYYLKRKNDANT